MSKPESINDLALFDYELPPELIARQPLPGRSDSRLLVVHRDTGRLVHSRFRDLPELLSPGDCLVVNDTRVLPARLFGRRVATGGGWEGLYLGSTSDNGPWQIIGQTRGRLQVGEQIELVSADPEKPPVEPSFLLLRERDEHGRWLADLHPAEPAETVLERLGTMPLPPYIKRPVADADDRQRYQTIFARFGGSAAAPTAGLHFTEDLLEACRQQGLQLEHTTLHIGLDTFRPISTDRLDQHVMHTEWCRLTDSATRTILETHENRQRVVAVGTTVVRTLESACRAGTLLAFEGTTDLFIRPGHKFAAIDALLTNFHLPRSSLFVLVSAFCGLELAHAAYAAAITGRYRFYSYGDAMLIL